MNMMDTDQTKLANAPAQDVRDRLKLEGGRHFVMTTEFDPAGDQPPAIAELSQAVLDGEQNQVLLGATGTGKTFTMARVIEVFRQFLLLGCSSFGGPVAHLGYFRERFVQREQWLTDAAYADLVALCQFLPGPASSQVGMGLGLMRAGWPGAVAAWIGFTFPSAILLVLASAVLSANPDWLAGGWVQGLKVAAVAVVTQAILGMQKRLAPDRPRLTLMAVSAILVLVVPLASVQVLALLLGAVVGVLCFRAPDQNAQVLNGLQVPVRRSVAIGLLGLNLALLPETTESLFGRAIRAVGRMYGG